MNSIADLFVHAYESKKYDLTPRDFLSAGWTYVNLAEYIQCCANLRSVYSIQSRDQHIINAISKILKQISAALSDLIGEEVHFDFSVRLLFCSSYDGYNSLISLYHHFNEYEYNDPTWFKTLPQSDEDSIQVVSQCIGRFLATGKMGFDLYPAPHEPILSLFEATQKQHQLENDLCELTSHPPKFNDKIHLSTFNNLYAWGKSIGTFISEEETIESEIESLDDYIRDPVQYILHNIGEFPFWNISISSASDFSTPVPPSAFLYVKLKSNSGKIKFFIVTDLKDRSSDSLWANRALPQLVCGSIVRCQNSFDYENTKYSIESISILKSEEFINLFIHSFINPNEIKTVYIYRQKNIHDFDDSIVPVTAYTLCANSNVPVPLSVYYDSKHNRYFINETSYSEYASLYGLPLMRLKSFSTSGTSFSASNLADKSILRLYGYTVGQDSDLTSTQRQNLLKNLMDSNLMNKLDIVNHLEWLINTHIGNYIYTEACEKWKSDLNFVNSYKINYQNSIWAYFVPSSNT